MRFTVGVVSFASSLAVMLGAAGCRDAAAGAAMASADVHAAAPADRGKPDEVVRDASAMVQEGRRIFRFDTFGTRSSGPASCG